MKTHKINMHSISPSAMDESVIIILDDKDENKKDELSGSRLTPPFMERHFCTATCPPLAEEPLPSTSFDNNRPFFDDYCFDDMPPPPSFSSWRPMPAETKEHFCRESSALFLGPSVVVDTESPMRVDFDVKTISLNSQTPMPNFDAMDDKELNRRLDAYGMRPMCKSKSVQMLKCIYDSTHPVLSASTPLTRKVQRAIATAPNQPRKLTAAAEKARNRRHQAKIAQLQAVSIANDNVVISSDASASLFTTGANASSFAMTTSETKCIETNASIFLNWLRRPENGELYAELLALDAVMLDRLVAAFGDKMRSNRISRAKFEELLDRLSVTYCTRSSNSEGAATKFHY